MDHDWTLTLKNLLFPTFCMMCRRRLLTEENGYFCPTCWELSPRIQRPFCSVCGRPHKGLVGFGEVRNFPCAGCRSPKMGRRPFRRIYSAACYQDAVGEAIKLFKFNDKPRLAKPLAEMMKKFAEAEMDRNAYDYVVPVPLYKVHERERGFNQSHLLAQELLPVFESAQFDLSLRRTRPTRQQKLLKTDSERTANVREAFAVVGDGHLHGRTVLLIDDVVTTGRTLWECAAALRKAGVEAVDGFATALTVVTQDS